LPLFLCLFTTLAVWSIPSNNMDKTSKTDLLKADNLTITALSQPINGSINLLEIPLFDKAPSKVINEVLFNSSSFKSNKGKSTDKDFSYKLLNSNVVSTSPNLTGMHFNSNLFTQGLFYGFALTVILLNLVCYFIFDESLFIYFSATFSALTITLFFAEGLFPFIGITNIVQTEILQSTFLLFGIALSVLFASKYLTLKDYYPKLNNITLPILIIATASISIAWIIGSPFVANLANALLFSLLSVYFITGVLLFSRKNYAKFYVIASFIPLLFSVDFFVLQSFGIDFLFTEAFHLKTAILFEALLLSYAIMYRMQAVKEEGVLRQTEMRIFLKRQDVMNRVKVEEMIEDIYLENLIMQYDLNGLEIKLLQYISEGKTNAKIARKLKLTESEIGEHTKELYQKLEISEQIQEDHRMVDNQPDYIYN